MENITLCQKFAEQSISRSFIMIEYSEARGKSVTHFSQQGAMRSSTIGIFILTLLKYLPELIPKKKNNFILE
jgi:hypothetical protein